MNNYCEMLIKRCVGKFLREEKSEETKSELCVIVFESNCCKLMIWICQENIKILSEILINQVHQKLIAEEEQLGKKIN